MVRKEGMKLKAVGISSLGAFGVYRQLWNIDIPQDITNFRQVQEEINNATDRIDEQRRYFYSKVLFQPQEIRKDMEEGIKVRDFIPTAGIIRIDLGNGEKLDLIANYPFDQLEEGKNLFALGRGFERREVEFEGELLYTEDLRKKKLEEIKLGNGKTKEEAREIIENLRENAEMLEGVMEKLNEEGIDINDVDLDDIGEIREVFEALKKVYSNLDGKEKGLLKLAGIKSEEDLNVVLTAKDIVDALKDRKRLEGKAYEYKVEFYPLNGVIIGENQNKELYFVFSPERVDWKEAGIGLAKRLDEFEYKLGNSILTIISNPKTMGLMRLLETSKIKELPQSLQEQIEEEKEILTEKLQKILKKMYKAEEGVEIDNRLFEITSGLIEAIGEKDGRKFLSLREELREWRNQKIWEKVGDKRIDIEDLLKKNFKYKENAPNTYFLKWSLDEQRTPLGFYRKLYLLTETDGKQRINKDKEEVRIYNNNVKIYLGAIPKIIPTDPTAKTTKATDLKFETIFKPYGILAKNTTITIGNGKDNYLFNKEKFTLGNKGALKEAKKFLDRAIEGNRYPSKFISEIYKESGAKVYRNDTKIEKNVGYGLYVEGYLKPIEKSLRKLIEEGKKLAENLEKGNIELAREHYAKYMQLLSTKGLRDGEGFYWGLTKLRDRISKFNQAVVYNTLLREIIDNYKVIAVEKSGIGEVLENPEAYKQDELKEVAEEFRKHLIPDYVKQFLTKMEEYDQSKERVERKLLSGLKNEREIEQLLISLRQGEKLDQKEMLKVKKEMAIMYKELFVKNLSHYGLLSLKKLVENSLEKLTDEKVKNAWENFLEELNKETINRAYTSQVRENIGLGASVGLSQLKKVIAIRENLEAKLPKDREMEYNHIVIRKIDTEGEIKKIDKELPKAKGEIPLLVKNGEDFKKIAEEVAKYLSLVNAKGEVIFHSAYETKEGIVYGFEVKLKNYKEPFSYTPQPNRIPTIESAMENLKRKGLFKLIKNLNKAENLENKLEGEPNRNEEIPKGKHKQQIIDEGQDKNKGKDLSL